jgi:hypothetical protein
MLTFKTFLVETLKLGTYIDDEGRYDIGKVVELLKKNPVRTKKIKINRLLRQNRHVETREGNLGQMIKQPSPAFTARTEKADTGFPILLSPDGWIADGTHRLAKLRGKGARHVRTRTIPRSILDQAKRDE